MIIIFVGSVFSPYYAWTGWRDPADHCAINVALYGKPQRWSMTERNRSGTDRSATTFKAGKSRAKVTSDGLVIDIDEIGAPLPRRLRGRVTVTLPYQNTTPFKLEPAGRHVWAPVCAHADVSVAFDQPNLSWQGHGYVDLNHGEEPLEKGFDYWDWSRTPQADGSTQIRYVTDPVARPQQALNLKVGPDGAVGEIDSDPPHTLPPTRIWRITRRTGLYASQTPRVVRTLEDTPFYSRSLLAYPDGTAGLTTHETLSGKRLRSPIVKTMLPFRMPRLPA